MDFDKPYKKSTNPERKGNWFLNLFFIYTKDTFVKGCRTELTQNDIYEVLPEHKSQTLGNKLENEWKTQMDENNASIPILLWKCFGRQYLLILISLVIPVTMTLTQPKILKKFISYFTPRHNNLSRTDASLYGVLLIVVMLIRRVYQYNFHLRLTELGIQLRTGFTSLIYRQALKINPTLVENGKMINLITRDVSEFEEAIYKITNLLRDLTKLVAACFLLYTEIGWLFLILPTIVLISIFVNTCLAVLVRKFKLKSLKKTDGRYQIIKEALSAIKVIKMNLWEESYEKKIAKIRNEEVHFIRNVNILFFLKLVLSESIHNASWYIIVALSIWFKIQSNAGTLFLIMNSLTFVSYGLKINFPTAIHEIATLIAVFKRIGKTLRIKSDESYVEENKLSPRIKLNLKIHTAHNHTLINLKKCNIVRGITAVTGPIGSGKTLLLKVLTKEYKNIEGDLEVVGSISYASQEPWLFPSTIKQNILFGSSYDENRYLEVLGVCALLEELRLLTDGDSTIVTDGGANLSKGQKARINLARAVYKERDIYLLDDCLASLDAIVADLVFEQCIKTFLKGKIVILVTPSIKYVNKSDNVITLKNGAMENSHPVHSKSPKNEGTKSMKYIEKDKAKSKTEESFAEDNVDHETPLIKNTNETRELYTETKVQGKVQFDTYKNYIKVNGGMVKIVLVLLITGIIQFLKSSINKMESVWINAEQVLFSNATTKEIYIEANQKRHQMLILLPIIISSTTILMLLSTCFFYVLAAKASRKLHNLLFSNVVRTFMQFFDNNRIGIILNRFSEDILYIDEIVPLTFFQLMGYFAGTVGVIILIATVNATFLIPCVLINIYMVLVQMFYLKIGNALKRLEFLTRSPVIGYINTTLDGLTTIRTSKIQDTLRKEFDQHQNLYASSSYMYACCEKAYLFLIGADQIILLIFAIILFLAIDDKMTSGKVGLVLSQIFSLSSAQHFFYRMMTRLENQMITVERVLEYTKQKQESKDGLVIEHWPKECEIRFKDVSLSYKSDQDHVLKHLNFAIKNKQKVAIVGRTGSGKTSLISTLVRLYDFEGNIFIDNVDIKTVPVDFLRSKISVIPQEPTIFSGTLRENVDPTGQHSDDDIWKAISTVNLSLFQSLDDKIDTNLSICEKQLICVCRALVRRNKIVIFDESNASVDSDTEALIQKIITDNFAEYTVIAIMHKLRYILDFDLVLVVDKGVIIESGDPSSLLKKKNGMLSNLFKRQ
ncbi:ATP-binding cassette sub-family C member 4-like [Zophobas morio]|uniref:ATP-binding cassette sub-family C member 4-like n=1 Tax=Zophobas morio TaxID=2755281 RepID=UPI003083BD7C